MGQDLSIVLIAKKVPDEILIDAAKKAFADEPPDNLVLLVATDAPPSVTKAMSSFTAVSLWADAEDGLEQFARELSRAVGKCIVDRRPPEPVFQKIESLGDSGIRCCLSSGCGERLGCWRS